VVYVATNDEMKKIKIWVSVSKHFKHAVDRNYFKRVLRVSSLKQAHHSFENLAPSTLHNVFLSNQDRSSYQIPIGHSVVSKMEFPFAVQPQEAKKRGWL
jgi:ribonuclease P protein component